MLLPLCEWLARTPWSIALHESLYLYPVVETTHVLALLLFVGTVLFLDLRLLGWVFDEVPVSEVVARLVPWALAGFAIMLLSGALLFYAIPVRTYLSIFFRVKLIALVAAGINMLVFHRRLARDRPAWDADRRPSFRVRATGAVSLVAWAIVIVMGRMIAYNWFDCDKPQSAFVSWAAGCPLAIGP